MSFETALLAAVAALGSAVSFIYVDYRKRAQECDDDRRLLWTHLLNIKEHKNEKNPQS